MSTPLTPTEWSYNPAVVAMEQQKLRFLTRNVFVLYSYTREANETMPERTK